MVTAAMTDARRATFGDAVRSELAKLRGVRSTAYLLAAAVAYGVLFGAVISYGAARHYATLSAADRAAFDPAATSLSSLSMTQMILGSLGILLVTAEFATGSIVPSMTVVPRRDRLLAAKAAVLAPVVLLAGIVSALGGFLTGQATLAAERVPHVSLGQPQALRAVAGAALYLVVLGLLALALGTLLRSTAGAIVTLATVVIVIPSGAGLLPDRVAGPFREYWPTTAGARVMAVHQGPHDLGPGPGFGIFCLAVAVCLAGAVATFRSRDGG